MYNYLVQSIHHTEPKVPRKEDRMNIAVLNGSPKGETSVTMQYVRYISKEFPQHRFTEFPVAQRINTLEKDMKAFNAIIQAVREADCVIWAFPLYFLLVPSQYKRFIELVFERGAHQAFKGKPAAVITTSIHFFDHTAHTYMRAICEDLGMRRVGAYSASMYDLLRSVERRRFREFAAIILEEAVRRPSLTLSVPPRRPKRAVRYRPGPPKSKVIAKGKRVLILADAPESSSNIAEMSRRLFDAFEDHPRFFLLQDIDVKGGCLGCIQCGWNNECVYGDTDAHRAFYEEEIKKADIIFFCAGIRDRYFSARWKQFLDRSFYNNHTPVLRGKQIAFIISGPFSECDALREFVTCFPEFQMGNLAGLVTDEIGTPKEIDARIDELARRAVDLSERGYIAPPTFPTVGGWKIFRDEIDSWLRFPFAADHRYYRSHGLYDFPRRFSRRRIVSGLMLLLSRIPSVRNEIYKRRLKDEMIKPFKSVLKN